MAPRRTAHDHKDRYENMHKKMHTGHFYFAKSRTFLLCVDIRKGVLRTSVPVSACICNALAFGLARTSSKLSIHSSTFPFTRPFPLTTALLPLPLSTLHSSLFTVLASLVPVTPEAERSRPSVRPLVTHHFPLITAFLPPVGRSSLDSCPAMGDTLPS